MPRNAIVVELTTGDIVWIAWAAGVAAGQDNDEASKSLRGVLDRLEFFEIPDETEEVDVEDNVFDIVEEPERQPDPRFTPPAPPAGPNNPPDAFGAGRPPGV